MDPKPNKSLSSFFDFLLPMFVHVVMEHDNGFGCFVANICVFIAAK